MYDGCVDLRNLNNPRTKIVHLVAPKSRVLEVGCATGYMSEYLTAEKHCDLLGVEFDPEAAAIARERGVRVVCGDVEHPDVRREIAGEYDVVIFSDVLEHLADPERTLRSIVGLLSPKGVVLASIPNVAHWSIRWRLLAGRFDYTDGGLLDKGHLRFFTKRTIVDMFERCGLRAKLESVHMFPRLAALPDSAKQRITSAVPGVFTYQFIVNATRA